MLLRKLLSPIKELGLLDGLIFILARALSRLTGHRAKIVRYYLVAQPVPPTAPVTRQTGKTTIGLTPADAPIRDQFPRAERVVSARYLAGARCITAVIGDQFAGFLWFSRDGYDEDEVRCRYEFEVPQESAWDFDVYVAPEYRVGRTFSRLWETANRVLSADGVKWTYSRIESSNPKSLSAHRRLGIRRLFSVTFICFGSLQITLAGFSPFFHISRGKGDGPTFCLAPPLQDERK